MFADLLSDCLMSTCINRDRRPCVRSFSWSPIGMADNSGYGFQTSSYFMLFPSLCMVFNCVSDVILCRCLLAVCTTEGRVKIYRPPFCDFGAEWIEVCTKKALHDANIANEKSVVY